MKRNESGQTLIETLVAAFVLIMGVSAALALGVYSLGASNSVRRQLVGLGLAREGIEVVKFMRDSNWRGGNLNTSGGANYGLGATSYYDNWRDVPGRFNLADGSYRLVYNSSAATPEAVWTLDAAAGNYGVNQAGSVYNQPGVSVATGSSDFKIGRRVTISSQSVAPYNTASDEPRLLVTVDVWWQDRTCPISETPDSVSNRCKVRLQTYLTNWKTD